MGFGDEIMGSGMARELFAVNPVKVAFGDGRNIIWCPNSEVIYKNNPKIARPGELGGFHQWCSHYRGSRSYGHFTSGRLVYNTKFRATRGEFFFTDEELEFASRQPSGCVIIEPRVKNQAVNKQWRIDRFWTVASELLRQGHEVALFAYSTTNTPSYPDVHIIHTPTIRHAAAVMAKSRLFVGPEGGLHHAAAAVSLPAVVIFGGFIHPRTTGYEDHVNLFTGGEPCGSVGQCAHCRKALDDISVDDVLTAIKTKLGDVNEERTRHVAAG